MSSTIGLTIFVMVLVNLFKSYELAGSLPTGTRLKVCGSQLANLLSELCAGEYVEKRSKSVYEIEDGDYYENNENSPISYDTIDADYGYRTKRSLPFLRILKAGKRSLGVADECCKKACTLSRLIGYCRLFQFPFAPPTTTESVRLPGSFDYNHRAVRST